MEEFVNGLMKGWGYLILAAGGVGALWNSMKLFKEIKDNISKPMKDLTEKVDDLGKRFDNHVNNFEEYKAKQYRYKILEYSDSITDGVKHSKESFDDMMSVIDDYEDYCDDHPKFKNNRCQLSIENIKKAYTAEHSYKEK